MFPVRGPSVLFVCKVPALLLLADADADADAANRALGFSKSAAEYRDVESEALGPACEKLLTLSPAILGRRHYDGRVLDAADIDKMQQTVVAAEGDLGAPGIHGDGLDRQPRHQLALRDTIGQ